MKLYLVTGASRGLGAALADLLIDPDHHLVCMARRPMSALAERAAARGCRLEAVTVDLGDVAKAVALLTASLAEVKPEEMTEACLINNAGTVLPVRPADRLAPEEILASIAVNLSAPMALTAAFLRLTADWPGTRKVINISSGAAHKPYQGWSVYCATKAAIDHFSRCVALEQREHEHGARIVAIAPGLMDTDMQGEIRAVAPGDFKEQSRFLALKASGALASPEAAARRIINHMEGNDFGVQPVVDLRDVSNS